MSINIRTPIPTPSHLLTTDGNEAGSNVGYSTIAQINQVLGLEQIDDNTNEILRLKETWNIGNITGTVLIDPNDGAVQIGTLTGNTIIELPALTPDETAAITLILTNDGSHAIDITSTSGFVWIGAEAPDLDDTDEARNVLLFRGAYGQGWIGDGGIA